MDEWLTTYSDALGVEALDPETRSRILELARVVAHGTERKNAPLAAFVAGLHAAGKDRRAAVAEALDAARRSLPEQDV